MVKLNPIERKLLRMKAQGKLKYISKKLAGVRHPQTGRTLTFRTLNISPSDQMVLNRLYVRGYISGNRLGLGRITKKGREELKRLM